MFSEKEIQNLTLKVNRICYSDEFRKYMTERYKCTPDGLTFDVYNNEMDELTFELVIKKYGYEHSCNNGITEFSDLNDYDYGNQNLIIDGMEKDAREFFRIYHPEIYFYMDLV